MAQMNFICDTVVTRFGNISTLTKFLRNLAIFVHVFHVWQNRKANTKCKFLLLGTIWLLYLNSQIKKHYLAIWSPWLPLWWWSKSRPIEHLKIHISQTFFVAFSNWKLIFKQIWISKEWSTSFWSNRKPIMRSS